MPKPVRRCRDRERPEPSRSTLALTILSPLTEPVCDHEADPDCGTSSESAQIEQYEPHVAQDAFALRQSLSPRPRVLDDPEHRETEHRGRTE